MVYTRRWPMCKVPEGYGNIDRMYDFGLVSVSCSRSTLERGGFSSKAHFACHSLSKEGRSSLRLEEVVARRKRVLEGRGIDRKPGHPHLRDRATRGVNRSRASVCMMPTRSSCPYNGGLERLERPRFAWGEVVVDLRLQNFPEARRCGSNRD